MNLFMNEIKQLDERIKTFNVREIVENCRERFEQWRLDSHRMIDRFFEQKCYELDRYVDEQIDRRRIEMHRLELNHQQELHSLRSTIDDIQTELNNLIQLANQITIHPLIIDDNLIDIQNSTNPKVNLSILSPIYNTINHPDGGNGILATNDQFMLIYLLPHLVLIDKQLNIIEQVSWPYDRIWNTCWSSALDRFIVIEKNNIYLVDDQTLSIQNLQLIDQRKWFACTCSDTSLFLSANDRNLSIIEYSLLPSIRFNKEWKSPYTCRNDENIDHIVYQKSTLALIVTNKLERSLRMELRLSETLERVWSFRFDSNCDQNIPFRCCSINSNEWLLADYQYRRLLHITKDGDLKTMITYNAIPSNIAIFGSKIVAISRKNGINFHRI